MVKGRTAKWLKIIKVGNDDFREVYETVWRKTIIVAEEKGIEEYRQSVAKLRATLPERDVQQAHTEFMPLYQEAARVKPAFDKAILELAARFEEKTRVELDLNICPRLKQVPRIIEKSLLKSKVEGDVSGIKDIVRFVRNANTLFGYCHVYVSIFAPFNILYTQVNGDGHIDVIRSDCTPDSVADASRRPTDSLAHQREILVPTQRRR